MKILLIILGIIALIVWLLLYIIYITMISSALILYSAGKMKTGNDLGEQINNTLKKQPLPNFFRFYWLVYKKCRRNK